MAARNYTNTHVATTLSGSINSSTTSITPTSLTGLPASYPYMLILDYGTAQIEVVRVDGVAGANLTVVRGQDGTLAQSHTAGATVVHGVVAADVKEPQDHIYASGDVHGIGASSNAVGTATTQTLTNKTISGSANTLTNISSASIADVAAAKITQPFATLAVTGAATLGSAGVTGAATVGGTLGVTGTSTLAGVTAGAVSATTVAASSNATVGGTLGVTGVTTVGTLNSGGHAVTGNATVSGTLGVTGATTLAAVSATTVAASSNATVGGTLGITGTTTAAVVNGTTLNGSADVQFNSVSLPRGFLGGKRYTAGDATTLVTGVTTTETLAGMDTGSVTLIANRRYRFHLYIRLFSSTEGNTCTARLRETNVAGTERLQASCLLTNSKTEFHFENLYSVGGSNETKTLVATIQMESGAANVYAGDATKLFASVLVEDVGPANAVITSV